MNLSSNVNGKYIVIFPCNINALLSRDHVGECWHMTVYEDISFFCMQGYDKKKAGETKAIIMGY